ncbi:MAG: argininosuccinate synthase [Verrucomicrobia bacterium]|nr:argininosuccinate synthase [Verrucomicrobiota bacterium]
MNIHELKGRKVGVCVSGGLDSKTVARKLKDLGLDVLCFSADLAQPDESDIQNVATRMAACGVETVIVDLKAAMADACFDMIRAQAQYDGGYWNSTGLARAVTVRGLLAEMRRRGCTVLAHGATGRGNDQVRFERYTNVLAPEMKVYAPWRDAELLAEFPGRKEMAAYLTSKGIEAFVGASKRYSTDANLAGLSYEAEDLESVETPCNIVTPQMGVWPQQAPDRMENITIAFARGRAVSINGKPVTPLEAMETANLIAGRNGVGIRNALENRVIGTKSRGVYEAPGMEVLGFALLQVYQAVLNRSATELLRQMSAIVARDTYDGRYYEPAKRAAMAAIDSLADPASGTITLGLYKGNMHFQSLTGVKASLYNMADSSMEASEGLNPRSSQGFVEVQAVEARAMARAGQISG